MSVSENIVRRSPHLVAYHPVWWHHHGSKMVLRYSAESQKLHIAGSAADLYITPVAIGTVEGPKSYWRVEWEIRQTRDEHFRGKLYFNREQLAAAFGIADHTDMDTQWMFDRYGADTAVQKWYIRWQRFLNIPGPGTGHDGDPNISIEIDDNIKYAVQQLLG